MNGSPGDIIHLLPDSVANQIAAGEVIQRPASVIKELVENSIDAGARNIEIIVKDAGKTLIQVVDDGAGMSPNDARMAFERHATSKIRCADDLFSLHTMGFRGEALPSIAAVAEIEVTTRRRDDELGTRLIIRASKVEAQEPVVCNPGTSIKVKNLFFNFVARRRFLKKDSIELGHIVHEFERLALVNTDVSFKFNSNGVMLHSLPPGPLKDRITALFGKNVGSTLIPVDTETSLVKINGFVSVPEGARRRGQRQFMFVNGRNMRHLYFHKAIVSCYDNLIAKDMQPNYFVNFSVSPDRIDVNIHPQKHEIKFEDEQPVWQILTASVRESLGRFNASSALEFNNTGSPDIPALDRGRIPPANLDSLTGMEDSDYNPFLLHVDNPHDTAQRRLDFDEEGVWAPSGAKAAPSGQNTGASRFQNERSAMRSAPVEGWQNFYKSLEQQRLASSHSSPSARNDGTLPETALDTPSPLVQLRNKYIVTEARDGLLVIDQHRAHTNVLYHDLLSQTRTGEVASQKLMFAEPLNLEPREEVMLDSSIDIIERIGFRIGRDDNGRATLEGVPGTTGEGNPAAILRDILVDLAESGIDVEADAMNRVLLTMARSAALRAGRVLTPTEMEHLTASLFRLPTPLYTPDGLTVIYRLTDERLASFFT